MYYVYLYLYLAENGSEQHGRIWIKVIFDLLCFSKNLSSCVVFITLQQKELFILIDYVLVHICKFIANMKKIFP